MKHIYLYLLKGSTEWNF